jgi:hypothetical protein
VDASATYVYGESYTMSFPTRVHETGESLEASWIVYGSDETTNSVVVSLASGSITSASVYPDTITASVAAGDLTVTMPKESIAFCIINGDEDNPLAIHAKPLKAAAGSTTDYTSLGSTVSALGDVADMTLVSFSVDPEFAIGQKVGLRTSTDASVTYEDANGDPVDWDIHDLLYVLSKTDADEYTFATSDGGDAITWVSDGGNTVTIVSQEWTSTATNIYFPAGVHYLCRGYEVGPGCTAYLEAGACVNGTLDLRGSPGAKVLGPGALMGEHTTYSQLLDLVFGTGQAQPLYTAILGDATSGEASYELSGFVIAGNHSLGTNAVGPTVEWCTFVSPWHSWTDAVRMVGDSSLEKVSRIEGCFFFTGDDSFYMQQEGRVTVTNCFAIATQGSPYHFGYRATHDPADAEIAITDCHAYGWGRAMPTTGKWAGINAIIKLHLDQTAAAASYGIANVTIDGFDLWGQHADCFLSVANQEFFGGVFEFPADSYGTAYDWSFDNVTLEYAPGVKSRIFGKDADYTPHDFDFGTVTVAGTAVTSSNASTYFTVGSYPYGIRFSDTDVSTNAMVVEDGTGLATANSYSSVASADTYLARAGTPTTWAAASDGEKEAALRKATRSLDIQYGGLWAGDRATTTQYLDWPRSSVYDLEGTLLDDDAIPAELVEAVAELAAQRVAGETIEKQPITSAPITSESTSFGGVSRSVTYKGSKPMQTLFPVVSDILQRGGLIHWAGPGWGGAIL